MRQARPILGVWRARFGGARPDLHMPDVPLSFLIVDDHALYRTGLGMALGQAWPLARVAEAGSLAEAWQGLSALAPPPALVMLDVRLPDGDGLLAVQDWVQRLPGVPVVLMSSEVDAAMLQRARERGAAGFVHKSAPPADIVDSVRSALAGQPAFGTLPYDVLSPRAQPHAGEPGGLPQAQLVRDASSPYQPSPLQGRILRYLGRGTPNKAIARQVGLSEMQVRAEVSWLTDVLGASSREEAYQRARDLGWVEP
jgi:two-component system nitrate/nitrite response regulator NarL